MKRKILIGLIVVTVFITGCQSSSKDLISETTDVESSTKLENVSSTDAEPSTETKTLELVANKSDEEIKVDFENLKNLIQTEQFSEYKALLVTQISEFSMEQVGELFLEHHKRLNAMLTNEINLYYSDQNIGVHDEINNALKGSEQFSVYGNDKKKILDKIEDTKFKLMIESTLDKGYALFNGEGTYYPQIDYVEFDQIYGEFVDLMFKDYIQILANEVVKPLTVEEYLNVDLDTLKSRLYAYEDFLQNYGKAINSIDEQMFQSIRIAYVVATWNLVNPNVFNNLLDENYYPKVEVVDLYHEIIKDNKYQITTDSATRILKIIEEQREDLFGSSEKNDKLFDLSRAIHEDAATKLDMMYGQ